MDATESPDVLNTFIGVGLAAGASGCASFANVLIKYTHNKNMALPAYQRKSPLYRPMWYFIFALFIANGFLNFASYYFASMTILAPVSALTIAFNVVVAYLILGEKLNWLHGIGTTLVIAGSGVAVWKGPQPGPRAQTPEMTMADFSRTTFVYFAIIKTVVLVLCALLVYSKWGRETIASNQTSKKGPSATRPSTHFQFLTQGSGVKSGLNNGQRSPPAGMQYDDFASSLDLQGELGGLEDAATPLSSSSDGQGTTTDDGKRAKTRRCTILLLTLAYSTLVAGVASWTNLLGKASIELVTTSVDAVKGEPGNINEFGHWLTWLIIVSVVVAATLQLKMTAGMMNAFDAVFIVPVYYSQFILQLILSGAVFFEEFSYHFLHSDEVIIFSGAVVLCCVGIALIACGGDRIDKAKKASKFSKLNDGSDSDSDSDYIRIADRDMTTP